MALINCPECGKEISDKAAICPQCGYPVNTGQPNLQENTIHSESPKGKKTLHPWLLALIILGSLLLIGAIVALLVNGNVSDNTAIQDSIQEEKIADIVYPNITEKGVEPFLIDASMFDIPCKGNYYDTILLVKKYKAYEECGEIGYNDLDEEKLKEVKKQWGDYLIYETFGYAYIMQDKDTLMKVDYDEKASINHIEVFSNHFQMQNGIQVGMSLKELYEKYNAKYYIPRNYYPGFLYYLEIPDFPKNIETTIRYNEKYEKIAGRSWENDGYYFLPLERIEDNSDIISFDIFSHPLSHEL
jgi:hypothetical protein